MREEKEEVLLGIETSGPPSSLAIMRGDEVLYEVFLGIRFGHSERLNSLLEEAMNQVGLSLDDLGLVSVSTGPGYFTALRAGLAMAKALTFSLKVPLVSVPTLLALAEEVNVRREGERVVAVVDAQRGGVYWQAFSWKDDTWFSLRGPSISKPQELIDSFEGCLFVGGGARVHPVLRPVAKPNPFVPRASTVARVGRDLFLRGEISDPRQLEPLYIKYADVKGKERA